MQKGFEILYLALAMVVINIVIYIHIVNHVIRKGEKFNLFKLKLMFPYVNKYKELTKEETGTVGILYKWWIATINLELLLVLIFIIIRSLQG